MSFSTFSFIFPLDKGFANEACEQILQTQNVSPDQSLAQAFYLDLGQLIFKAKFEVILQNKKDPQLAKEIYEYVNLFKDFPGALREELRKEALEVAVLTKGLGQIQDREQWLRASLWPSTSVPSLILASMGSNYYAQGIASETNPEPQRGDWYKPHC